MIVKIKTDDNSWIYYPVTGGPVSSSLAKMKYTPSNSENGMDELTYTTEEGETVNYASSHINLKEFTDNFSKECELTVHLIRFMCGDVWIEEAIFPGDGYLLNDSGVTIDKL